MSDFPHVRDRLRQRYGMTILPSEFSDLVERLREEGLACGCPTSG